MSAMTLPVMQGVVWRCVRCGGRLGTVVGDRVEIKHEGRTITARLPCDQECDRCKTINHRAVDTDALK